MASSDSVAEREIAPTDFMRSRRPELFSDSTLTAGEPAMDRAAFEFYLDTLTQRKEEIRFEHFCRRLAEKMLCPNLLPQTGPTGGGDSKVDSETYPVASEIAERWYEGDVRAASERWAFAFSAKRDWRPKVKKDIKGIVSTGRPYAVIYFVTNQSVSDRKRSSVEDELSAECGIDVRILDRTWIVDKVFSNNLWGVVCSTLDITEPPQSPDALPGPRDLQRQAELLELDGLIANPERYDGSEYQLVEDCLQTALLARGLGRPRDEVESRFDRAERLAKKLGGNRQLFRVIYQRAWTAFWWFEDFEDFNGLYKRSEDIILESASIWELDSLCNLWTIGAVRSRSGTSPDDIWKGRLKRLRSRLEALASDKTQPTSALRSRAELVLLDLVEDANSGETMAVHLGRLKDILIEARGHLEFPVDTLVDLMEELASVGDASKDYDDVIELLISIQSERVGSAQEGRMRLRRGQQKLEDGDYYGAISQLARAQTLLAQAENKGDFVRALLGTAIGYESVGLLWAARANLVFALDRTLYEFSKDGTIPAPALFLTRRLIWLELQLGRACCALNWIDVMDIVMGATDPDVLERLSQERLMMDGVFGILVLRTKFDDLADLTQMPDLLKQRGLQMASVAALYTLGHEDFIRAELGQEEEDLDAFFSLWLNQPAKNDVPPVAQWHLGPSVTLRTVVAGCELDVEAHNNTQSIMWAEAILAFIEAFLATVPSIDGHLSPIPRLLIRVGPGGSTASPLKSSVEENEVGELAITVLHTNEPAKIASQYDGYDDAFSLLLANVIKCLYIPFSSESLEAQFAVERAQDRAHLASQSPRSVTNLLGTNPPYHVTELMEDSSADALELRRTDWPTDALRRSDKGQTDEAINMNGADALRHCDLRVVSPIYMPLWDKASWAGVGFVLWRDGTPQMTLIFENLDAGEKIFRGWQERLGATDNDEWIGVTVITGVDRLNPPSYRVLIGLNDGTAPGGVGLGRQYMTVARSNEMTPKDTRNIDRFIEQFAETGRYRLAPGAMGQNGDFRSGADGLYINKKRLRVVPAWEIGPNDLALAAIGPSIDPVIPTGIVNAPIEQAGRLRGPD